MSVYAHPPHAMMNLIIVRARSALLSCASQFIHACVTIAIGLIRNTEDVAYPAIVPVAWAVCSIVSGATPVCTRLGIVGFVLSHTPERWMSSQRKTMALAIGWQLALAGLLSIFIRPGDPLGTTVPLLGIGRFLLCVPLRTGWGKICSRTLLVVFVCIYVETVGNTDDWVFGVVVTFAALGVYVLFMSVRDGMIHKQR